MVSIDSLRCFEAAARLLNFRTAARTVALSPAAFGQRIKQLEEQLGTELFVRTTRSVQLTRAGSALLPAARACLAAAEECTRAVHDGEPLPIELTLGTRFELGMSWIVPQLEQLDREFPHLTLHLYFGSSLDLLSRLRSRDIDCMVSSVRLPDASLAAETLHQEEYAFVAAPALLERTPFTRPEHAARHCLLDIDASMPLFRYLADGAGGVGRFPFRGHRWLGLGAAIKARVLAGEGVAVLPLYMVAPELKHARLRRLLPKAELHSDHFRLVFRRDDPRRSAYEALAGSLRAVPIH
jgi:DNA-binding transcriptional LysR family regulator